MSGPNGTAKKIRTRRRQRVQHPDAPLNEPRTFVDKQGRLREESGKYAREATPVNNPIFGSVTELTRSFFTSISGVLRQGDLAFRRDRNLQKQMRRDPDVMGPLLQRQMAVAMLDWEVDPEDPDDETQVEQAQELQTLIEHNMRSPRDFFRHLMEAVWYGPSAANVIYSELEDGKIAPTDWQPMHPDSLMFLDDGRLAFKVGFRFPGKKEPGWDAQIHILTPKERLAVVLHTWRHEGADFDEAEEASFVFAGRGLRDMLYWTWLMKQTALQRWMDYIERYSGGIRKAFYDQGSPTGRDEIAEALRRMEGDNVLSLPRVAGQDKDLYDFEILEPKGGANSAKVFADLVEWLAGNMKELILGQAATTEATNTGLGSDVATQHAETFNRILRFDTASMNDAVTRDFIVPLHEMNFGDTDYRPRFRSALERVQPEEHMRAVTRFVAMGGEVSELETRNILGLAEPKPGERTLQGGAASILGQGSESGLGAGDFRFAHQDVRSIFARSR